MTILVKFVSRVKLPDLNIGAEYTRRFPGSVPEWGGCRFSFDPDCQEYDWLVAYDDLPRDRPFEELACLRRNSLLITGEPSSITRYGRRYLAQFGHVLSSQEPGLIRHERLITRQCGLFWFYGGSNERGSHDALANAKPPHKTHTISTVCSTKAQRHTMNASRLAFVRSLMDRDLPEIDVWGYGIRELQDKADAIDPYRYHLVIENHSCPHHWTEKLADAYLGFSLPVYFGCTNPGDYFPRDSYVAIDIRKPDEALGTIRRLLEEDPYEERLPAIMEARRRVLEEYATFPQLARLIRERHAAAGNVVPGARIFGRRQFRKAHPLKMLVDAIESRTARPRP